MTQLQGELFETITKHLSKITGQSNKYNLVKTANTNYERRIFTRLHYMIVHSWANISNEKTYLHVFQQILNQFELLSSGETRMRVDERWLARVYMRCF
jgi:hypothetical protein